MNIVDFTTNTSKWSLVFHKVSQTTVQLWAGTLFGTLRKPKLARLIVSLDGNEVSREDITLNNGNDLSIGSVSVFMTPV